MNTKNSGYIEKIEQLKQNFPEFFQDGKLSVNNIKEFTELYSDDKDEAFSFSWIGKNKSKRGAYTSTNLTLKPNVSKSKNYNDSRNIYIEGDNLNVLKVLRDTYANKIKMIYLDPPYNTGNEFVYEDDFEEPFKSYQKISGLSDEDGNKTSTDEEQLSGRKHTNWLNMMYPRLLLSRDLLSEDGFIFISIDDNEQVNLRNICNEIFGESNFIGQLMIENNPKGRKNSDFISVSSEYLIIYAKNKKNTYFIENIPKPELDMVKDSEGVYVHNSGKRVLVGENRFNDVVTDFNSDKHYSIYYSKIKREILIKKENKLDNIDSKLIKDGYVRYISYLEDNFIENTYTEEKIIELFNNNALEFKTDKIYEKNFSSVIRMKNLVTNRKYNAIIDNDVVKNYEIDLKTTSANKLIKKIFKTDKLYFENSKNIGLIKLIITLINDKDNIILDLFSGSATTAHAVMKQNSEDGGNRKYIMVQLPEKIDEKKDSYKAGYRHISEIGQERIRRSGDMIIEENPELKDILDIGFKVFELAETNFPQWNEKVSEDEISEQLELIKEGEIDEKSSIYEVMLLLKNYLLDEAVIELMTGVYSIGDENCTLVSLLNDLTDDAYNYIVDNHKNYTQVIVYDNSLSQTQKINLKGFLGDKMETI